MVWSVLQHRIFPVLCGRTIEWVYQIWKNYAGKWSILYWKGVCDRNEYYMYLGWKVISVMSRMLCVSVMHIVLYLGIKLVLYVVVGRC